MLSLPPRVHAAPHGSVSPETRHKLSPGLSIPDEGSIASQEKPWDKEGDLLRAVIDHSEKDVFNSSPEDVAREQGFFSQEAVVKELADITSNSRKGTIDTTDND